MIKVSRLNNKEFYVNAEMVAYVEATPDTVITLNNEKKLVVSESVEDIINRILDYKKQTMSLIKIKQGEIG